MNTILLYRKRLAVAVLLMVFLLPETKLLAQTDTKTLRVYAPQSGTVTGATPDSIVLWHAGDSTVRKITLSSFSSGLGLGSNYWGLTGNSITLAGTNFIGTTNDQDVIFKRYNVQAGWLNNALENTAFGVGSLPNTSTGAGNTAFGYGALSISSSGVGNIAIGYNALNALTTGSYNIGIGVGTNVPSGSNQMNIGNAIFGTGMTGSLSAPAGNIGINVTNPTASLEVNSPAGATLKLDTLQSGASTDSILVWRKSDSIVRKIPSSSLSTGGGGSVMPITIKTNTSYTALATDYTIICNNTGAYNSFTLTLPSAAANTGKIYRIVVYSNDITIVPGSTSLLDLGQSVNVLHGVQDWAAGNGSFTSSGGKYELQSDGTNWYVIGN